MTWIRRKHLAAVAATAAVAFAAAASGASAQAVPPVGVPLPLGGGIPAGGGIPLAGIPIDGTAVGGNQIGTAGCVGTNRPSLGGNNGSTSAQTCGALLSFSGPQIGQIASVVGPTIIGSPGSVVAVAAGGVQY
ncbi:MAG: hypothetical protein JWO74_1463 [Solirubrobacterales bacterium]|nr:hypothetical protein [Solirubrobacterales bacterium]